MSMVLPPRLFLCLILISLTRAGPFSTTSIAAYPTSIIRTCAQACVDSFIADNYQSSSCGSRPDLSCLCTADDSSGFTIGEGALECAAANCPPLDESEATSLYDVCAGVEGAKPNTHSVLTATETSFVSTSITVGAGTTSNNDQSSAFPSSTDSVVYATSSIAFSSNIPLTTASSPSPSSSLFASTETSQPASSVSGIAGSGATVTESPSASKTTDAATASSTAPAPAPTLSKPKIAGIAVAGVGAAALAFGLCFFLFCFRKRKQRRHSGSSFGGDKIMDSEESTPDMAVIARRDFEPDRQPKGGSEDEAELRRPLRLVTPGSSSEDGWDQYQRNMNPDDIGLAVAPRLQRPVNEDHSPAATTPASNRTYSQLLPDKPRYSLFPPLAPPPLRVSSRDSMSAQNLRPREIVASESATQGISPYRPTPRFPGSVDTSQAHLQRQPESRSLSDPFYDAPEDTTPDIYPFVRESRPRSSSAGRRAPESSRVSPWAQTYNRVRRPIPAHQSPSAQGLTSRTQQPSLPRPYPPPPPIEQHYIQSIKNSERRQIPSRKLSNPKRPATDYSDCSVTDIEDSDEDEDVRDPRAALSPVAESPVRPPHRNQITYPAVPISAAESPTRNLLRPQLSVQTNPLLGERLGEQKAREIADRLRSPGQDASHSPGKPAKYQPLNNRGFKGTGSLDLPSSSRRHDGTSPRGPQLGSPFKK